MLSTIVYGYVVHVNMCNYLKKLARENIGIIGKHMYKIVMSFWDKYLNIEKIKKTTSTIFDVWMAKGV